jgi:hypothetical protein
LPLIFDLSAVRHAGNSLGWHKAELRQGGPRNDWDISVRQPGVGVDPVTVAAVLAAIAGGAGGTLGAQMWAAVSTLVRRPFQRGRIASQPSASGELELAALAQAPGDQGKAVALAGGAA